MDALVIGGGGFLGTRLVELLLSSSNSVKVFGRSRYSHLTALGVESFIGDLGDIDSLRKSMIGVDTVFHLASKAGYFGKYQDYYRINVEGTSNVISAAIKEGVDKLVYTSSPAVVGFGTNLANGGNDIPYPENHESPYSETKAKAERLVKRHNGNGIATVCLRPHMIFGPGDRHVFPRLISRASQGRLKGIGNGKNLIDLTYVDNAAFAHIDAAAALTSENAPCAGRSYFISNGQPVAFYPYLNNLLENLSLSPIEKYLSHSLARRLGGSCEAMYKLLPLKGEPLVTRYLADMLAHDHWYDLEPARRDLGYTVRVPMETGTDRTLEWLREKRFWQSSCAAKLEVKL